MLAVLCYTDARCNRGGGGGGGGGGGVFVVVVVVVVVASFFDCLSFPLIFVMCWAGPRLDVLVRAADVFYRKVSTVKLESEGKR